MLLPCFLTLHRGKFYFTSSLNWSWKLLHDIMRKVLNDDRPINIAMRSELRTDPAIPGSNPESKHSIFEMLWLTYWYNLDGRWWMKQLHKVRKRKQEQKSGWSEMLAAIFHLTDEWVRIKQRFAKRCEDEDFKSAMNFCLRKIEPLFLNKWQQRNRFACVWNHTQRKRKFEQKYDFLNFDNCSRKSFPKICDQWVFSTKNVDGKATTLKYALACPKVGSIFVVWRLAGVSSFSAASAAAVWYFLS